MLQAALKEKVIGKVEKKKKKGLHGEFVQQTSDVAGEEPWRWLRNGFSNSLILATSSIKQMLCRESTKTVWHIVNERKKLVQNEYRKRHDKLALRVLWKMCRKYAGIKIVLTDGMSVNP